MEKSQKKQLHKAQRPFKGLAIASGVLTLLTGVVTAMCCVMDNSMAILTGGTFWRLDNADASAKYYKSDFSSQKEKEAYEKRVAYDVEAEGATLLKNDHEALPLTENNKVSLFSTSSVDIVFGGTGSGGVDASKAPTMKEALEDSGIQVNETLWDFYTKGKGKKYRRSGGGFSKGSGPNINEAPYSLFSSDVIDSFSSYGDAAIITIGRIGGEGSDLPSGAYDYLSLNETEKDLFDHIKALKEQGVFKKIVLLLNSSNPLELDFLKDNRYDIDSVLWIGGVGQEGLRAVGDILVGKVNPSGSLPDTFLFDNSTSPAMKNSQIQKYDSDSKILDKNNAYYFIYQEGIYVGYKYYETRYFDVISQKENVGSFQYDKEVAYPFGYGLSYTDFRFDRLSTSYNPATDTFEMTVKVTNQGTKAGKTPLQIYASTPYGDYEIENRIEKPAVQLVGFTKSHLLEPGEEETCSVDIPRSELASYDSHNLKSYYTSEGTTYFTIANGAHEAVNNILTAQGKDVGKTMEDVKDIITMDTAPFDGTTYTKSRNGTDITNQFDHADITNYEEGKGITYVSRSDWKNTLPKKEATLTNVSEKILNGLVTRLYDEKTRPETEMPDLGKKNGVSLIDLMDKSFDDPLWEKLLSEMSFDEMLSLTTDSFHFTMPITSIQAPGSRCENGPQGLSMKLFNSSIASMSFSSEDVMAATLNKELMKEVGKCIGMDCLDNGISFLYGPGNNIHRTPYGGRNFEYYSEDGYLSGAICTPEVQGIQQYGVGVLFKHFVLNDSEQQRLGQGVWLNEQSLREIYLKAFQEPVEIGKANGVMVSYTRLGTTWCGADKGLLTNVLRNEWGCEGILITDNNLSDYMDPYDSMIAGVTTYDAMLPYATSALKKAKKDPYVVSRMREACHYNLYSLVHSNAMNNMTKNTLVKKVVPPIIIGTILLTVLFFLLFILFLILSIRRTKRFKKSLQD